MKNHQNALTKKQCTDIMITNTLQRKSGERNGIIPRRI